MKQRFILLILIAILLNTSFSIAQNTPKSKPDIYDPDANVKSLITVGLKTAEQYNKHLLLMFGGNWCPWCHKLHELFESDVRIKSLLDTSYILILVDVGEKKGTPINRDLVKQYRVEGFGYPALAVIGKDGTLLSAQSTGVLENGNGHDPERVLGYLKSQAPGK
jgi:thioredoxin-related protein